MLEAAKILTKYALFGANKIHRIGSLKQSDTWVFEIQHNNDLAEKADKKILHIRLAMKRKSEPAQMQLFIHWIDNLSCRNWKKYALFAAYERILTVEKPKMETFLFKTYSNDPEPRWCPI